MSGAADFYPVSPGAWLASNQPGHPFVPAPATQDYWRQRCAGTLPGWQPAWAGGMPGAPEPASNATPPGADAKADRETAAAVATVLERAGEPRVAAIRNSRYWAARTELAEWMGSYPMCPSSKAVWQKKVEIIRKENATPTPFGRDLGSAYGGKYALTMDDLRGVKAKVPMQRRVSAIPLPSGRGMTEEQRQAGIAADARAKRDAERRGWIYGPAYLNAHGALPGPELQTPASGTYSFDTTKDGGWVTSATLSLGQAMIAEDKTIVIDAYYDNHPFSLRHHPGMPDNEYRGAYNLGNYLSAVRLVWTQERAHLELAHGWSADFALPKAAAPQG